MLDPSIKFVSDGDYAIDYVNNAVLIAETDGVQLYGVYPDGKNGLVIIEHGDAIDEFEQDWLTPRTVMPCVEWIDLDGDGEDELAVAYYVGSGTGVSVEELVVYKTGDDGHFVEYRFDAAEELENMVNYVIDNDNSWLDFAAYGTDEIYSTSTANDYPDGIESIGFGNVIGYELDNERIILEAVPDAGGMLHECMPKITAEVEFDGEAFDLVNIDFKDNE